MKKYMGNKSKILGKIYEEVEALSPESRTIFDAFSGTTNVGQFFKRNGYQVISNDVNTTSRLLGNVYIKTNTLPAFQALFSSKCPTIEKLNRLDASGELKRHVDELISQNHNTNDDRYMRSIKDSNAIKLLAYLSFAADHSDVNDGFYTYKLRVPDFFWRNFCHEGTKSAYFNLVSQKSILSQIEALESLAVSGIEEIQEAIRLLHSVYTPPYHIEALLEAIEKLKSIAAADAKLQNVITKLQSLSRRTNHTGNRMFFSEEHGHRIDIINDLNLLWFRDSLISYGEYCYLQCALVEAAALFSNTSATYQAFYKTYRENTKQTFRLVVPEIIPSSNEHCVYCEDTFKLIETLTEPYDVLYLDPPYNWRIYDSNYHLLNLISDFDNVADDVLEYENEIAGAAGENRALTRAYTNYNRRNTFEDLLFKLILKSSCKYIVISYSDSLSNHNKNSLSSVGRIENFLQDASFFEPGYYKKVEAGSINFESRKNKKKGKIHELLFIAKKKEQPI